MTGRRPAPAWPGRSVATAVAAAVVVFLTAFLPWVQSGQAHRNGFRLARTAERLDLVTGVAFRALLVGFYLLPFLAAVAWTAAALRRPLAVAIPSAAAGLVGLATGWLVLASGLDPDAGPYAALAAGALALAAAGAIVVNRG